MLPHASKYNTELGIVETEYIGVVTYNEIIDVCHEIPNMALKCNCFLTLGNYSKADLEISVSEIYNLPKIIAEILLPLGIHPHKFKRAFVITKHMKDFHFFETVTLNSGQKAKVFLSVEEARDWLLAN
jgi:hypothetical protein